MEKNDSILIRSKPVNLYLPNQGMFNEAILYKIIIQIEFENC
jgi:hypothetical protein